MLMVLVSIGVVVAHRLDWLQVQTDLLSDKNHSLISTYSGQYVDGSVRQTDDGYLLECQVRQLEEFNHCALHIVLSKTEGFESMSYGKDLSKYDAIRVKFRYLAQADVVSTRISLRNYHERYFRDNDYTSLKYNSMIVVQSDDTFERILSLDSFFVEEWWLRIHNVAKVDSEVDFSNVPFIEILPHAISRSGNYQLLIMEFSLIGSLLSESELFLIIIGVWSIFGFFYISTSYQQFRKLALTDVVTGLINRRGITDWGNQRVSYLSRGTNSLTLFFIDIDDFKYVNDRYGHLVGDQLLIEFSSRLRDTTTKFWIKKERKIARLSGDEFAVVVANVNEQDTIKFCELLVHKLQTAFNIQGYQIKITTSIGASASSDDASDFDSLLNQADLAMYCAKKNGKNTFKLFDDSLQNQLKQNAQIASALKEALLENLFRLVFMPIYSCEQKKIVKLEVLIRSSSKRLNGIGPDRYIPIAEEFGIINEIDFWVLDATFKFIKQHQTMINEHELVVAINISAIQVQTDTFALKVKELITRYQVNPTSLEFEITETALIDSNETAIKVLTQIKKLGISIALDDFGTGYTAFKQLHLYPVNGIKIDKSFIDGIVEEDEVKMALINAMLTIAKTCDLEVVAEGIETAEQLDYMNRLGCDNVQGYYLSKPINEHQLLNLMNQKNPIDIDVSL